MKNNAKIDANKAGISLAVTLDAISLVCLVLVTALPRGMLMYGANSMFHAMNFSGMIIPQVTLFSILTGLLIFSVLGYLAGVLFATVYNKL